MQAQNREVQALGVSNRIYKLELMWITVFKGKTDCFLDVFECSMLKCRVCCKRVGMSECSGCDSEAAAERKSFFELSSKRSRKEVIMGHRHSLRCITRWQRLMNMSTF